MGMVKLYIVNSKWKKITKLENNKYRNHHGQSPHIMVQLIHYKETQSLMIYYYLWVDGHLLYGKKESRVQRYYNQHVHQSYIQQDIGVQQDQLYSSLVPKMAMLRYGIY